METIGWKKYTETQGWIWDRMTSHLWHRKRTPDCLRGSWPDPTLNHFLVNISVSVTVVDCLYLYKLYSSLPLFFLSLPATLPLLLRCLFHKKISVNVHYSDHSRSVIEQMTGGDYHSSRCYLDLFIPLICSNFVRDEPSVELMCLTSRLRLSPRRFWGPRDETVLFLSWNRDPSLKVRSPPPPRRQPPKTSPTSISSLPNVPTRPSPLPGCYFNVYLLTQRRCFSLVPLPPLLLLYPSFFFFLTLTGSVIWTSINLFF